MTDNITKIKKESIIKNIITSPVNEYIDPDDININYDDNYDEIYDSNGEPKGSRIKVITENNNFYIRPGYSVWQQNGDKYIPEDNIKIENKLPAGLYKINYNDKIGYYTTKQEIHIDEILELPSKEMIDVLNDVNSFWDKKESFKKYKFAFKRGILLHGPPGSGKSTIIQLIIKNLVEKNDGLVFFLKTTADLENYMSFMPYRLRIIEPTRPIITIIEDIDGLTRDEEIESMLLNVLDGAEQMEDIVYIATTNYPEKLKARIINRPSRFDKRYLIGMPSRESREYYFKHKIEEKDLLKINLPYVLDKTENMSMAHLREFIASVFALGNDVEETLERLINMKDTPSSDDYDDDDDFDAL